MVAGVHEPQQVVDRALRTARVRKAGDERPGTDHRLEAAAVAAPADVTVRDDLDVSEFAGRTGGPVVRGSATSPGTSPSRMRRWRSASSARGSTPSSSTTSRRTSA